ERVVILPVRAAVLVAAAVIALHDRPGAAGYRPDQAAAAGGGLQAGVGGEGAGGLGGVGGLAGVAQVGARDPAGEPVVADLVETAFRPRQGGEGDAGGDGPDHLGGHGRLGPQVHRFHG